MLTVWMNTIQFPKIETIYSPKSVYNGSWITLILSYLDPFTALPVFGVVLIILMWEAYYSV